MNRVLLTLTALLLSFTTIYCANPHGDLRIEMLDFYNLVVDHNIQTPAGASPKAVYIGVKICNDGNNDLADVFAFIGNFAAGTPGIYPTVTPSGQSYSGTFSFTHEGGQDDATRFIGNLAAGECITQYWLLSYPLVDANNNPVFGSNSNQNDDLSLSYDVWATAIDNGNARLANDSKTLQLRAQLSASSNKIWPNNANAVPSYYRNAFPDKQVGWRMTGDPTQPGSTVVLEGIWFRLGRVNRGFDNDGDYQKDYNFMIQPVGDPSVFDPNCFRLVKVSGLIVVEMGNQHMSFEFEDQLHFKNIPTNNTDVHGMVFYEFAVLNGPCNAQLTPYQEAASGNDREKFNSDFGTLGGTLISEVPAFNFQVNAPATAGPGDQVSISATAQNTGSSEVGRPDFGSALVFKEIIPDGMEYVNGSAEAGNTLPPGANVEVIYSTDDGATWSTSEPVPASSVDQIQWWLDEPLAPGETASVTFSIEIPVDFTGSAITVEAGLATGNNDPFISNSAAILIQGGSTIDGAVFMDNGEGGAILGDGVQDVAEPGIPDITVALYNDLNNNGQYDSGDPIVSQTATSIDGSFSFTDIADGNYILAVDRVDADLPQGFTNTTPLEYTINTDSSFNSTNFGFAQILEVTNTLLSDSMVFETNPVRYKVSLKNLAYAIDADGANSTTVIAWASQVDPATNFYYSNKLTGEPDQDLAFPSNWSKTAKVKGFDFSGQIGEIVKVELIFSICLDYPVFNDQLILSFVGEDGNTYSTPDPALSKNSTPSLNDYVGPPNIGWIILDVTEKQEWDWDIFDPNWAITIQGIVMGSGDDGSKQYIDAVGVRVTTVCSGDFDGDGVCNNQDCSPTNPALPAAPGTPCNDNDPDTGNDVIQADGCTCAGYEGGGGSTVSGGNCSGCDASMTVEFLGCECVNVSSCKNLSNVVIRTSDGVDVKYDNLSGYTASFCSTTGSPIEKVWVKSGCFQSGDGPGYGRRFENPINCDGSYPEVETGESGNSYATITELPLIFTYDESILEFVDASVTPDQVDNGIITFDDLGPLYPDEVKTVDINFKARQPNGNNDPITSMATVSDGENGEGLTVSDSDESEPFYIQNLGSVAGFVFGDADGDGWIGTYGFESGVDNFIPGVEVNLYACVDDDGDLIYPAPNIYKHCTHSWNDGHWEWIKSDTTDANGAYNISGIDNGYYYIEINETTLTNAEEQTADPDKTYGLAGNYADNRWKNPNEQLRNVGIIGIGNDHQQVNFGYYIKSTISGIVWEDANGNGVVDPTENKLSNVPVEFVHTGCTQGSNCPEILTNGDGEFTLNNAVPGTEYTIKVDLNNIQGAESWTITYESDGTTDNAISQTVSTGQQVFGIKIGLQPAGDLNMGGIVYYDWSGNAHKNAEDEGMANVTLKLYKDNNGNGTVQPSDQLIQTIATDINGNYLFANKPSGNYIITLDEATVPIFPKQTEDPDEYGVCVVCDAKTVVTDAQFSATVTDNWNYYNQGNSNCKICDEGYTSTNDPPYVSNNLDIINFTDPIGNPSICITEIAVTFNVAASDFEKSYYTSQVDNVNYFYPIELNGVQIGTFNPIELPYWCDICESITIKYPVDLNSIPYNYGGNNTLDVNFRSFNMTKPSNQRQDICVADIKIEFLGSSCTSEYLSLDFGYQPSGGQGEFIGFVFLDENANGIANNGESKISNIEVKLEGDMNNDGVFYPLETYVTDNLGLFFFSGLIDGHYRVVVNQNDADLPVDYSGAIAQLTTAGIHEVVISNGVVTSIDGEICSNNCESTPPVFGFAMPGSASGYVFSDDNGDGTQNEREAGIPGITVYICSAADGYCDATNALDTVITSDGTSGELPGFYRFTGLVAGNYTIAVDPTTVPHGYDLTADPSTDGVPCYSPLDPEDPDFEMLNEECDNMLKNISINLGSQYSGADFGYQPPGIIGGRVWFDFDKDGIIEIIEDGIENSRLELRNVNDVTDEGTVYTPGNYTRETFTDNEGSYVFTNLPDGTFDVQVTPDSNTIITFDADGIIIDSITQVCVDNGEVTSAANIWCPDNDCSLDVNFGVAYVYTNSLEGIACLDKDEDGKCNTGGETFPAGTEVLISDLDGKIYGETQVAADGTFFFDELPSDNLVVSVAKTLAPLKLTSLTTSLGDTPAYGVFDSESSAYQYVAVNGHVTDMHFGFTFSDTFDVGDLPLPYLTRVDGAISGPAHMIPIVPNLYLGNSIDAESEPSVSLDASGDDLTGMDDEDGISFSDPSAWTTGPAGGSLTAQVNGDGHLVAFADFDNDGDFSGFGEMIINAPVSTGNYNFDFDIPASTDLSGGQDYFFRFRLFETQPFSPAIAYNGIANNGEVEDYRVSICKNLSNPGTIAGAETGCDGFDPAVISPANPVDGGGGAVEYQWQMSTDGGLTWTDVPGAVSASFDPDPIVQTTRYRRGARRARCSDFVYSNTIVKTVLTNFTDPGIIVGDEDHCGIFDPDIILNVVAPSGGTGTGMVYYQWQQSTDGGSTWMDIVAANDEFFNPGVISQTTQYRRGVRKSPCADLLFSNVITKMVAVNFVSPGAISGDESICGSYDPGTIISDAPASGGVDGYQIYQWERSTDGGITWTTISGATGATYNPGVITQTTRYRRKARRTPCTIWVNSNVVTKEVRNFPVAQIVTAPSSISGFLCELTDYTFDAADAGTGVAYTWNFGAYGTPSVKSGRGAHQVQFDVPDNVAYSTTTVTLTTTRNGCAANDARVLNIRPEIQISDIISVDPDQCDTTNGSIMILANYPAGESVLYSIDGGLNWDTDSNFDQLGAGVYEIMVRYANGDCPEDNGIVTLSEPPPAADLLISSSEECAGSIITVEAVATSGAPVFNWVFGNGAMPSTATGPGPHNIIFSNGGAAPIALTLVEGNCTGVLDTTIAIVGNYTNGGTILGGEILCSSFDPDEIVASTNPSGGAGGSTIYQWEKREYTTGAWGAWTDIAGADQPEYDPPAIAATTEYRRKVRRAPCSSWVYTNAVAAVLVQKPNLGDDNYSTVCPGFPHADNVSDNDLNLVNPSFNILLLPTNGTLDFDPDGEFIYSPNSTFCGTDEFSYYVCNDGSTCCDTAHVVIDLTDTDAPSIVNVPADITISCDDQLPEAEAVEVVENCQSVSLGLDEFLTQGTDSCSLHNYQWVRIWNGVDYCTNTASAQQVIHIEDNTAPDIYRVYKLPNGKSMIAGVMENVSEHWKTVSLPIQFATQPVILTQVTTRNESSAVVVRLRNISTTQFQIKIQEEEANDGTHQAESVAWVAIEKGAMAGSMPFEVNTWLLNSNPVNKMLGQMFPAEPDFFASVQTNNDEDLVNPRISNLTSSSLDIWLSEETSLDPETTHNLETVGYFACHGAGDVTTQAGEVIGEVGRVNLTEATSTIHLNYKYHNPVVIIGALTANENDPVTARVQNVTATSFEVRLEEFDYLDGIHGSESVPYMVIEGSLPFDQTISCDAVPAPLVIGTEIIAVDNCDATIKLTLTDGATGFDCLTDTTFTRSWYTVDDCGNVTELVQTYYLIDTVAPVFTVPPTVTIVCTADKNDLTITGDVTDESDNCAEGVNAVYTDNLSNLNGCYGHIVRTWTAEDDCGNSTVWTQIIYVAPEDDSDHDGVVDFFDLDDDNDGIPDIIETAADTDMDGIPNLVDRDSDNDGIPDLIETGGVDSDGDGAIDIVGTSNWDNDGDGFAYGYDGSDIDSSSLSSIIFDITSNINDRDGDGIPNFLDRDSDNDGIPDIIEAGGLDTDGDGVIDYPVPGDPSSMLDADGDGFNDKYDPDDDNLPGSEDPKDPLILFNGNEYTGGLETDVTDADSDQVPDFLDNDSDNDGISDLIEAGGIDTDGDGRLDLNGSFIDLNDDGYHDIYVTYPLIKTDGEGSKDDDRPEDTNNDGTVFVGGDIDKDGHPNHRDRDSDQDNILDIFETGLATRDGDADGEIDDFTDIDYNGFDDLAESSSNILTEGDGSTIDGRPEDGGDADTTAYLGALPDGTFASSNGNPDIDDDGDGILNFLDTDSDNDFLSDMIEDANHNGVVDPGETDPFNPDTDGDAIKDGVEDRNRNGKRDPGETDPLNPDTDGDQLLDGEEDEDNNGLIAPNESDPVDPCDPYLSDECKGLVLNVRVKLVGPLVGNDTTNIMRDELRFRQFLPTLEPYTKLTHIQHVGEDGTGGGGIGNNPDGKESILPGMLFVNGLDAPVDWVLIELRDVNDPGVIVASRAALLQADGDVRDVDGIEYVHFNNLPSGEFFVAVRHRNHLGVMTAHPYLLSPEPTSIDFTDPDTEVYGTDARKYRNGEMMLWPGDFNGDGKTVYQGPGNDILKLFEKVLTDEENSGELANFVLMGYRNTDLNLDGVSIYQGPGNDRAQLLINATFSTPENYLLLANYVLFEKLP